MAQELALVERNAESILWRSCRALLDLSGNVEQSRELMDRLHMIGRNSLAFMKTAGYVNVRGLGSTSSDEIDRRTLIIERAGLQLFFSISRQIPPVALTFAWYTLDWQLSPDKPTSQARAEVASNRYLVLKWTCDSGVVTNLSLVNFQIGSSP